MKYKLLATTILAGCFSNYASAIEVELTDSAWDGVKIPEGQQCQKFGGQNPMTPALKVSEIPAGSDSIVLAYSDRDSEKMNNGGHGVMSYEIDSMTTSVAIPKVAGHSYDLPEKVTMIEAHRSPGWDKEGAYMPPCSGAKDHAYYVTVKAMKGAQVTATTVLELGNY
ncbi:hypothetical protein DS885_14110 [Psychromonas sp. B3M02]|uniref:hypothetical protein n=1 Tax=Psychromonas sp. B3M02 TaxID=2267226 RepID=UPI000DE80939|nr:hypothetical protein [Psychromonas sp. B3M02]RBW43090.1 hypothetical protein DS885_14110 [Psychromonas sp. B3M02]